MDNPDFLIIGGGSAGAVMAARLSDDAATRVLLIEAGRDTPLEAVPRVRRVVMFCRTFPIRVGGPSGPMTLEISYEELASRSGIPIEQLKETETTTTTTRQRRLAEFDWKQFQRSVFLNGPTDIALTFVHYFTIKNRDAYRFEQLSPETLRFIEEVERVSGQSVSLISTDFNWRNVIDRRCW
jgi:adenylosuccinate synthase